MAALHLRMFWLRTLAAINSNSSQSFPQTSVHRYLRWLCFHSHFLDRSSI